jgi:8-oxo-dGTP pyrophosphatase MutT (NUDIX family)
MERKEIFKGRVIQLGLETIQFEDKPPFELEIVRHPGGAAVVAIDDQNKVCLIRQYRHAVGGWIWEIPAGKLEPNEPPHITAERELEEEVGLKAQTWYDLGSMYSSPGFCSEEVYLYLAKNLTQVATNQETHEYIEIHWMNFEQALQLIQDNTIRDAKSVIALFRTQPYLS